ncbi:uracil-DNA glycosylase [Radiobacillus kanasensis]|uniref:uracil-DNA glycosylase n=1 Tax=Radiobacillus kanasensis TaxID=2844358 RepID=UPI001E596895|nr:uracil-DNA glycosylase [Radiobacillus kanasensis]UFT99437.1 uracil-DNA glycosylase [Radiobacillus kanasensis]
MFLLPDNDWKPIIQEEMEKEYFQSLMQFLEDEYQNYPVYPKKKQVWEALRLTSLSGCKVCILGQDPYHGPNQAHGLSFSVQPGQKTPPSLRNMFKELQDDLNVPIPSDGYLANWAKQGVLLLNTVLTVRDGEPYSHQKKGWETFTNRLIDVLNQQSEPIVFILWGKHAQEKQKRIDIEHHDIITSPHPSPLSARRGFFGSKPFSKTNQFLKARNVAPIDWSLSRVQSR